MTEVGIVLERRRAERRTPLIQMFTKADEIERRGIPHYRAADLLSS